MTETSNSLGFVVRASISLAIERVVSGICLSLFPIVTHSEFLMTMRPSALKACLLGHGQAAFQWSALPFNSIGRVLVDNIAVYLIQSSSV